MSRSKWKGPFLNIANDFKKSIFSRNTVIMPKFVNKKIKVYNGKKFVEMILEESMIGHKLGEFANTRAKFAYKKNKKNKR